MMRRFMLLAMLLAPLSASALKQTNVVYLSDPYPQFDVMKGQMSTDEQWFYFYESRASTTPVNMTGWTVKYNYSNQSDPRSPTISFRSVTGSVQTNYVKFAPATNEFVTIIDNGYAAVTLEQGAQQITFARGTHTTIAAPEFTTDAVWVGRTNIDWLAYTYRHTYANGPYRFSGTGIVRVTTNADGSISFLLNAVTNKQPNSVTSSMLNDGTIETNDLSAAALAALGGGVTDHGALTGLDDDDHTNYVRHAEGNATYVPKTATNGAEWGSHAGLATAAQGAQGAWASNEAARIAASTNDLRVVTTNQAAANAAAGLAVHEALDAEAAHGEVDTLETVVARGATTTQTLTLASVDFALNSELSNVAQIKMRRPGGPFSYPIIRPAVNGDFVGISGGNYDGAGTNYGGYVFAFDNDDLTSPGEIQMGVKPGSEIQVTGKIRFTAGALENPDDPVNADQVGDRGYNDSRYLATSNRVPFSYASATSITLSNGLWHSVPALTTNTTIRWSPTGKKLDGYTLRVINNNSKAIVYSNTAGSKVPWTWQSAIPAGKTNVICWWPGTGTVWYAVGWAKP